MPVTIAASAHSLALGIFAAVLAVTLVITYWAARRTRDVAGFWTAERSVRGVQNGFAIAGDYLSASTFLGITGLVFLVGIDGTVILVAALLSFLPVLLLLAERMRNAGKFTAADVLAFRLRARPARTAAALTTLTVAGVYLMAQMLGAGVLLEALAGLSFPLAVILTGTFMVVYVVFGGMLATTWVQIIKAGLLMTCGLVLTGAVLAKSGFSLSEVIDRAVANHPEHGAILKHGLLLPTDRPLNTISYALVFLLGTAGLPHILIRFFTVPDAKAARVSVAWATFLIGVFFLITALVGFAARAYLTPADVKAAGETGNLAGPLLAQRLGGGPGTDGGAIALALISAVAFATILAVVAGLVISAAGAVTHDLWTNVVRKGTMSEEQEPRVARIAALAIGVVAIVLTIVAGSGFNITVLVGLAFTFAASANFPALLLALSWRRFNTAGAVTGVAFGLISSLVLIFLGPQVLSDPVVNLEQPAIITVPLGFLGCVLGTLLGGAERTEQSYDELFVRSEAGIGAEGAAEEPADESRFTRPAPAGVR